MEFLGFCAVRILTKKVILIIYLPNPDAKGERKVEVQKVRRNITK